MIAQIQVRRGTTAEWAAASPVVLEVGEQGYDTTLKRLKVGDGVTEWASLEWDTLRMWPIGAIYMSVVSTSPATLFGGTWAAWGAGRVPAGIDSDDTDFDTAEKPGGAKAVTLTAAESGLRAHKHAARVGGGTGASFYKGYTAGGTIASSDEGAYAPSTQNVTAENASSAHNNLQPYIVCYMWKRTA